MQSKLSIVNAAKARFPFREYGYSAWFKHPGAIITQTEANNPIGKLMLRSDQPRHLVNGRFYPGWDCIEATHFLKEVFDINGYPSAPIRLRSNVHDQDFALISEGEIYSITPGVEAAIATGQVAIQGEVNDLETLWEERAKIDHPASGEMVLLHWRVSSHYELLNYAGIYFQPGGIFELVFQTNLIDQGKKIEGMELSFLAALNTLATIREMILTGETNFALKNFQLRAMRAPFSLHNFPGRELEIVREINSETARDMLPEIIRLLDPDWLKLLNTPKRSFFSRLFK